ncbi:MAG: hypothetical protein DRP08_05400 [Candidatus Aenigmatarchaeota archaeon]|nr:MAG: hypothetical protein DRP08_05400 [Candidatus Aenigmarchaeota archaeon]
MEKSQEKNDLCKPAELRKLITAVFAIAGIVVLELYALSKGLDGKLFGLVIAAIAGLGGYSLGAMIKKNG